VLGALSACTPGVDYTDSLLASLNIVHADIVSNGAQIVLNINSQEYNVGGANPWEWSIGIDRTSSSIVCKYDQGAGFVDWITYTDSNPESLQFELFANGNSGTSDLALDNFSVVGNETFSNVPVFTVEAVDANGDLVEIVGLTDSNGQLIQAFDVINDTLSYNSFISNRVQIATDNQTNGSLYFKIGTDIYKYNKSQFPLTEEDGSNAVLFKAAVVPETTAYAFAYSGYSKAGLSYIEYDDIRESVYLKTISESTISGTNYESMLDVSSSDYPWAWDQNNFSVLYYVSSASLKEYDMDEEDVAFCNVNSEEKIMAAGTASTSNITATVLNVYGEPLSSKMVTFSVSAGAGALSPSSDCTDVDGEALSVFTVGETVGITTITATASDTSC
jgi:hypothetical protein